MWYIHPTEKWIDDVVRLMNEKQLKPEASIFMMAFFSSLDNEYVDYFKNNKDRISSFSGRNFHIFTPLIYDGNIIPDEDWRYMRREFINLGIPIKADPTFIFFSLKGGGIPGGGSPNPNELTTFHYYPEFFAGFTVNSFSNFPNKLRNAIDTCIETRNTHLLATKLSEIFLSENIIMHGQINYQFGEAITKKLPKSTLFISHSSIDKPFVKKIVEELSKDDSIKLWIDEKEIAAGNDIQNTITSALSSSDFFLLIISENSTKSSWVHLEVSQFLGFAQGRNIIPIVISKGHSFPEPINNLITRLKYLDFTDETKWQKNIQELKQVFINSKT